MQKSVRNRVRRWLPAVAVMLAIFVVSSRPAAQVPDFGAWDRVVKKAGHMLAFGVLGLAIHRATAPASSIPPARSAGLNQPNAGPPASRHRDFILSWALTLLYAMTDELHQRFVPGRQASLLDVFVFDNLGAALALCLSYARARKRLLAEKS